MLKNISKFSITIFFVILFTANLAPADDNAPLYLFRGVRPMSLGNAFEAIADDINALHYNPAGIAQIDRTKFELLFARARITTELSNELETAQKLFEDTIDPIINSDDPLTDPALKEERKELVDRLENMMQETLDLMPDVPAISLIIPYKLNKNVNLSFGGSICSQSNLLAYIERRGLAWKDPVKDMLDNAIVYDVIWQLNIQGAIGVNVLINKPFLKSVGVGFDYKNINRQIFSDEDDPFTVADILNPDGEDNIEGTEDDFSKRYFDFDEDSDVLDFIKDNFEKQSGYSTDLGFLVTPLDGFNLALSIRNLASNLSFEDEDKSFPRNIVYSAAIKPFILTETLGLFERPSWFELTFSASIDKEDDDLLREYAEKVYTPDSLEHENIHLGTEFVLLPRKPISLSFWAGNNQGYPTFGTRLALSALQINFAKYADLKADWYVASVEMAF